VERVRETFLKEAREDRDLPAPRLPAGKPAPDTIRTAEESVLADDRTMARRVGMC